MVTEAFRANAGIVGAKLVDWDRTDVLRGVGMGIDKFGFVVPRPINGDARSSTLPSPSKSAARIRWIVGSVVIG